MKRAYYLASLKEFLNANESEVLGSLVQNSQGDLVELQRNAWLEQIQTLKNRLTILDDYKTAAIAFEYGIPRMGKRTDTIIFINGVVFVLEFKVGDREYKRTAIDQVLGYALDLKNFHKASHELTIVPMLIATRARREANTIDHYEDNVYYPLRCNEKNYAEYINIVLKEAKQNDAISANDWFDSKYKPTPNIIEAAQALYAGHKVEDISRSDATAKNLKLTEKVIFEIIEEAQRTNSKSICFLTGVPGAGKTLAGLNIATKRYCEKNNEHAVFLSGNLPLVKILQEALARDEITRVRENKQKITKSKALSNAKAFIQNIHHFRDDYLTDGGAPSETITIFDEAQRAWTLKKTQDFMRLKRHNPNFKQSEPEFLVSVLDRHDTWAVIICLIGSGQEIHTGEAGIGEWFSAMSKSFNHWKIYVSNKLNAIDYANCQQSQIIAKEGLHLSVSMRSYRSENVSEFVQLLLESDASQAKKVYEQIKNYPIVMTRDINEAKAWINAQARATEKTGIVASSTGGRLRPYGINVKEKIDPVVWFLNDKSDVRSSNFLENVATEFDVQGLELDWVCVAWDADLQRSQAAWEYRNFSGTTWRSVNAEVRKKYLLNSYRVLLTRARQGMIIFVPEGEITDLTRKPEFYNPIYDYFLACGIKEI